MIIELNNTTHPEVTLLAIDIARSTITFQNMDGVCSCPLIGEWNSTEDIKASIEAILGESEQ